MNDTKVENSKLSIKPENAYWHLNKDAISKTKKEQLLQEAFTASTTPQGLCTEIKIILTRVKEIKKDTVLPGYNQPLAGKTIHFVVKISDMNVN